MHLRVSHVRQLCALSYIVKYEADIEFISSEDGVVVEVQSTVPHEVVAAQVAEAKERIRAGAESVLRPKNLGAIIRVHRLCIHDVDFSPKKLEQHTAEELEHALASEPRK
jgi:hypothetical protein